MHFALPLVSLLLCLFFSHPALSRRTAPRRTTESGGTYGTNTFAPVTAPTIAGAAAVTTTTTTATSGPKFQFRPRDATVVTVPPAPTTPDQEYEEGQPDKEKDGSTKPKVLGASLCEEVEEMLPPGTTQEECFTGEPVRLRYWQPWRALRNIKCKTAGNDTTSRDTQRCALAYPGASCVQKYQQFVILAAMGPAASGWSCVRLGSGCSCSVRSPARLRKTDYEQRSDLREFLKQ